ncbi:MAG TPA: YtxH domain-containing protein [Candidatus Coprenecus stercoripullorum]|nr:YtxH domain-containing protein [Candidatus Coprenecus stercoripullorum]
MKGDTFFAFVGGLLVGAAAAVLFAPDSGDETRKKIRETFDKEYSNLKHRFCNAEKRMEAEQNAGEDGANE